MAQSRQVEDGRHRDTWGILKNGVSDRDQANVRACARGDRGLQQTGTHNGLRYAIISGERGVRFIRVLIGGTTILSRDQDMKISARDVIKGTVLDVKEGLVNCQAHVDIGGDTITSMITNDATKGLGIAAGGDVHGVIKVSEDMLATD